MTIFDDKISNYREGNRALFLIFSFVFASYVGIHSLYVYYQAGEIWILTTPILSLFLMFKPSSVFRFILLACASFIGIWSAFPSHSNSTLLTFALVSVILCSFLVLVFQKKTLKIDCVDLYTSFAPGGRILLITLYFYGVFQKINSGFMNPEYSCATEFMNHFRFLPQWFIDHWFVEYSAIYGTFFFETAIAVCLLFPRTRYWGIIIGCGFHFMLSFNTYQYFHTFTTLAILMHFLYLDPRTLERWNRSVVGRFFINKPYRYKPLIIVWLAIIGLYIWLWLSGMSIYDVKIRAFADLVWIPMGLSLWFFSIFFDRLPKGEKEYVFPKKNYFISPNLAVNFLVILYFLQCLSPYLGLKSEQALNMYSNLRVTQEVSNHYIIQKPINIFPYQKDLVKVIETDSGYIQRSIERKYVFFAIDFFNYLARNPDVRAVYLYNGKVHHHNGASQKQIEKWKLPYLAYKLMSYNTYPEDLRDMHCTSMHK